MMSDDDVRNSLSPVLNDLFCWKVGRVNNQNHLLLFILDYSPGDTNLVSFALELSAYREGKKTFPSKYWMTNNKVKFIDNVVPSPCKDYQVIKYRNEQFYPFSAVLSTIQSNGDKLPVKETIEVLYAHIDWG